MGRGTIPAWLGIGGEHDSVDQESQDRQDADSLYRVLADEVAPSSTGGTSRGAGECLDA